MINKIPNMIFAWFQQTSSWQKLDHLADGVYLYMRVGEEKTGLMLEQAFRHSLWRIHRWAVYGSLLPIVALSILCILAFFGEGAMALGREITVSYLQEQDLLAGIVVPDVNYLYAHHNSTISENDIVGSPQWVPLLLMWVIWACFRYYPPYCYWLSLRGIFLRARLFHALQAGKRETS